MKWCESQIFSKRECLSNKDIFCLSLALSLFSVCCLPLPSTAADALVAQRGNFGRRSVPAVQLVQFGAEVRRPRDGEVSPGGASNLTPSSEARALPKAMTVCRGTDGCWSEVEEKNCSKKGGAVFRTLPVDESEALPAALRQCQEGAQ